MSSKDDNDTLQAPLNSSNGDVIKRPRSRKESTTSQLDHPIQPDGGWGWIVCFTSMACNGTVFGIINNFGILYVAMMEHYAKDDPHISFKTAWVGSVATGITFFMCSVSSIVSDRAGIRKTALFGGVLAAVGMLSSAFVEELMLLYLTYGVIMGFGFAFSYAPSLVIVGHYFNKRIGLANGLVTFGSSAFTIALALVLPHMLSAIGLRYTLLFLAGMVSLLIPYSWTWKPIFGIGRGKMEPGLSHATLSVLSVEMIQSRCNEFRSFLHKYLNVKIWRNKGYVVWALSCGVSLFGYFVPFVHLIKFVKEEFPDSNGNILIMCIAITSGVARIFCGKITDFESVNRIWVQQGAFALLGISTLCIPLSESFGGLIAITLIMGICDGVFVCLLGPIAFDIVGERDASQAIGFLLGIFSIPMTVGPPVAGMIYDYRGSYDVAFYIAGCPPIVGALMMLLIPKKKQPVLSVTSLQDFAAVPCSDFYHSRLEFETEAPEPITLETNDDVVMLTEVNDNNEDSRNLQQSEPGRNNTENGATQHSLKDGSNQISVGSVKETDILTVGTESDKPEDDEEEGLTYGDEEIDEVIPMERVSNAEREPMIPSIHLTQTRGDTDV